ncbi:unnamed protein product [Oppiella nova]|uniref:Ig-like domain-containing protein n=1 Tax=Oppiella nova TaxID=334625 RepID=A0A7R9MFV8_9ACAR|nr:unnamed protein product [Oppiella nova]CAG2176575.1 unnamed protein product [Oppiella nova]
MLLVVQNVVIVDNPRINITKTSKGDISYWSLIITNASLSDSGYYICQIHTTPPKRLLKFLNIFVPLQFDKIQSMESNSVVRVRELQNVNLTCKATGNPKPTISWRKQDGQPLLVETNSNQIIESIESEVLHLREVSRSAIGYYVCIASNQIIPPTITVPNKMVSSYVDQNVTLECITESNPKAQHFWIDVFGNQIDSKNSYKYIVKTVDTNGFKTIEMPENMFAFQITDWEP